MGVENLEGKTAFVTGAASGQGRAIALAFARAGANVAVVDIASDEGEATAAGIRALGGNAFFICTDVGEASAIENAVEQTATRFGTLDYAANVAGIMIENKPIAECDDAVFDRVMRTNARSVFLCMKHQIRRMLAQGHGGAIANIASVGGFQPQYGLPAYVASKHAVIGLTRNAALEYGKSGIRVNAICPGLIRTPMLAAALKMDAKSEQAAKDFGVIGRIGEPEEVADAVLWMCSDRASFVVGSSLVIDGGHLMR